MEFKFVALIVLVSATNMYASDSYSKTVNGSPGMKNKHGREILIATDGKMNGFALDGDQQEIRVSGTITDAETGDAMPGVNVLVRGTTLGVLTDLNGKYSIVVPDRNAILVFSFIGYSSIELPVAGQNVINVVLKPELTALEEVVVIGYGTMKKSDITGAISSVSSEELREIPSANILERAQGQLAGVDIARTNGAPGSGFRIRIRGNRSINASNDPLYVVDGIPTTQGIIDFNPNDIESMEVLKDASAVAIYGSRGANGVILITTKKGQKGKTEISYDGYFGIKKAIENLNPMNGQEFIEYFRITRGLAPDDASQDERLLAPEEYYNYTNGISTDYLDYVLRDGTQQEHLLSVSGSGDNVSYYISGGYYDEEGLLYKSDYKRYSVRTNLEAKLNDKTKVGIAGTASSFLNNVMSNSPLSSAIRFTPLTTPFDSDGNFLPYPGTRELETSPILNYQPGQYANERKGYRFFYNIYTEYAILKDLKYRLNFGIDYSNSRRGQYSGTLAGQSNSGSIQNELDLSYTMENILTWDKTVGEHEFNVVGLFSTQKTRFEGSSLAGRDIPIEGSLFYDLGSATLVTSTGSSLSEWGLLSYMMRLNYQFKNRYLFTVSGRADGSSRLADGNKWDFFPAVAFSWIISEENFFNSSLVSFLKLRTSYGEVGNTSISPYQTLGGLERTVYAFGDDPAYGYGLAVIPNPDLGWEVSKTVNFGIDIQLLDGKVSGSFEYYQTNTTDLLLSRLIPISSGYESILQNIGSTRNRGWEFSASSKILSNTSGLNWGIDFNIFSNREKIMELFNKNNDDVGNGWFIGSPVSVFYSYKQEGIWQTNEADQAAQWNQDPGDIKIADVNGRDSDGNLTKQPDGKLNTDDRMILGSREPKWSGGITNNLSYKNLSLSVNIYARQGQMLSDEYYEVSGGTSWRGRYNHVKVDYWMPDNPQGMVPMPKEQVPLFGDAIKFFNASFVKVKNITLGYNLNDEVSKKLGINALKLYVTANNAFTFSNYNRVDPETASGRVGPNDPLTSATYLIGVNLKF